MGKSLADIISRREKHVIAEGQETANFWVNLGGKTQYANSKRYHTSSLGFYSSLRVLFD
jgi:villin 1